MLIVEEVMLIDNLMERKKMKHTNERDRKSNRESEREMAQKQRESRKVCCVRWLYSGPQKRGHWGAGWQDLKIPPWEHFYSTKKENGHSTVVPLSCTMCQIHFSLLQYVLHVLTTPGVSSSAGPGVSTVSVGSGGRSAAGTPSPSHPENHPPEQAT